MAMRLFFPLISVIKAPSRHSSRNNTSNSNLIILRNSQPGTFSPCRCLSVDALRCDAPSGRWECEGNNRPVPGLAPF